MSLYSSDVSSKAGGGNLDNGLNLFGPELEKRAVENSSWCYLFVYYSKVDVVDKILKEQFRTFIHRTIIYKRGKSHVESKEVPTITGLIFVQGDILKIQSFLNSRFIGLHLVKDCSTKTVAVIPDRVMQSFIQVSQLDSHRIRFMPHSFDYYAEGHTLVKMTSGVLAGMEGYQVRISRDKCFVTTLGGMTVAIGGVSKETFEDVDEYIRQRRVQLREESGSLDANLTVVQQEIDKCFFSPENRLDVISIASSLDQWLEKSRLLLRKEQFAEATEIVLFILEEIGSRFQSAYGSLAAGNLKEMTAVCAEADRILGEIAAHANVPEDLMCFIAAERQSLVLRYSFLPMEE